MTHLFQPGSPGRRQRQAEKFEVEELSPFDNKFSRAVSSEPPFLKNYVARPVYL